MRAHEERTRYAIVALAALIATVLVVWPVWPGFMSFDSLLVYRESIIGVKTAAQPPVHAYLFGLFRTLGLGTGGLFFCQTFLLFLGSALIMQRYIASLLAFVIAFIAYVASFYFFPTMLGALIVQWKDVLTTSFFVFGVALWLEAGDRRSFGVLAAAVFLLCLCAAARLNAIALAILPLALTVVRPFGLRNPGLRMRGAAFALVAIGLFGVYAQLTWRLPDFARLPSDRGDRPTMAWDLLAISACEGIDLLPPVLGPRFSADELRELYDYRVADLAFRRPPGLIHLRQDELHRPGSTIIQQTWRRVVPAHLGCYLDHRGSVFIGLLGLIDEPIIEPTANGIDPNPYGLRLEHPAQAAAVQAFVVRGDDTLWRRPFFLYVLAPLLATAVVVLLGRGFIALPILTLSAWLYFAGLVLSAPAIAGRYPFPSNVLCDLVTIVSATILLARFTRPRGVRSP